MPIERLPHRLSRRDFLRLSSTMVGATALSTLFGGCATSPATEAPPTVEAPAAATAKPAAEVSEFGATYPADAAPKEYQFTLTVANSSASANWAGMDICDSVYARAPLAGYFSEPLIRLDNNFAVVPGQATRWEVSDDGLTWTFHMIPGLMWTDGNEVTAEDYVATFRFMADPEHAYDFVWYWQGVVKNFKECASGEMPLTELGVRVGADKYTVEVETYDPTPFLPGMMLYSSPLSKVALEEYGSGVYNTNPDTCVSCGPYVLEEWSPDRRFVLTSNPKYKGTLKPYINKLVANVVSGGDNLIRYQAGEVDTITIGTAEIERVMADPVLQAELRTSSGDFRTYYGFFDTTVAPWDNLKVRQAFAKAVDREAIVDSLLAPLAISAYSFLMPGFPDADQEGLKPIQMYDPEGASALLAEAGYPDGVGFPQTTLIVRGASTDQVPQAVAASITQTLGIPIEVVYKEDKIWNAELLEKPSKVPFGYVSYGMDYFDATNMLGVWLSGGRHTWSDATFDKLVKEGGRITDDLVERSRQMQEAERILVESCAGIFVYHQLQGQLHKPYRKGSHLLANKFGYDGVQWAAEEATHGLGYNTLYMGQEVVEMRKFRL